MKKTLIVCGEYPLPENNGSSIRTMNFLRFFKEHGPVDLAYSEGAKALEANNKTFRNEYPLRKVDYPERIAGRVRMMLKGLPYPVRRYETASRDSILSAINRNNYQYILVRYVVNSSWLFELGSRHSSRVILDFDDLISESVYFTFFDPADGLYKRLCRAVNRRFLRAYESNCAGFGASLFCTDKDKLKMAAPRVSDNGFVVPNVYPHEAFSTHDFGDGFLKPNTILFVGDLRYEPNVTGLMWFVDEVYPHLRRKHTDVKLLIVGRAPSDAVSSLQQKGLNIEVRADAPDLKPIYERCRAVVVPVLTGGGTRIKILEAAVANRPVLSTPKGAEGLDLHDGVHIHLFGSGKEFVEKYEQLNNAVAYHSMVENAREVVLNKYSTRGFSDAMSRVVAHINEANHPV